MKKTIFYSIFYASLLLLSQCNGNKTNTQKLSDTEETDIPNLEEISSLEHKDDDIQIYTTKIGNDADKDHLTASFPVTSYDFVNTSEKEFTQKLINEFKTEVKNRKGENSISALDFNQHFEVKIHNKNILVFLYNQNVSSGNNYDDRHIVSAFDLKNKKKIRPQDWFKSAQDFKDFANEIKSLAKQEIQEKIKNDKSYANDEERQQVLNSIGETLTEGSLASDENYDALFPDEQGNWFVIFDKYQIASGAMGSFTIKIPKEIINQYISEEKLNLLREKTIESEAVIVNDTSKTPSKIDCSKVPCVALTFDDGPSIYTPELLDILKKEDVKATFFVLGKSASVQKNILKRIATEGHNIGNHSYDHKDFRKISESEARKQISLTDEIIKEITGEKPKYFRFPYGAHTKENLAMVGRPVMMWSVDPLDWKHKDINHLVKAMSNPDPQGIILAHDIHKTTVQAIPQVIKNLKAKGFHIVTLDDLFQHKKLEAGKNYSNGK